jgi:pimeloyl-ACP methyl ester carboxylesterase
MTALGRIAAAVAGTLCAVMLVTTPAAADTGSVEGVFDAGGQRQWISCSGQGGPTIVIASGLGASHTMWRKVLGPMRQTTRVCISDRPGLGSSPARRGSSTTDAGQHAAELRALLARAGESGPFILVGHSYAGLIVRAFAAEHPTDVAGVMLLDAVYPGIQRTFLSSYRGPWHEGGTTIDMAASERATRGGPDLGDTPLVVITAGDPAQATSWADRKWNAEQSRAARLSSVARHWYAKRSGHVIQQDQPSIVLAGAAWLLSHARGR